jgi:hypothetical protein
MFKLFSAETKFGGRMWWCTSMRFGLVSMSITLAPARFAHPREHP